jgi:foldase protein PrsA
MTNNETTQPQNTPSEEAKEVEQQTEKTPLENSKLLTLLGSKTAMILAAVFVIGASLYYAKGFFIAATVNGTPISRYAIVTELESMYGGDMLENLIVEQLIKDEAMEQGVYATEEEINNEIDVISEQVNTQGQTLQSALIAEGITMSDLRDQIAVQKSLEKLLADEIAVTEEDALQYITENEIEYTEEEKADLIQQVQEYLGQQALNTKASELIERLKEEATINYFRNYQQQ